MTFSVNTPEDQAIIRYLLGDLGDSETEQIEERYFCDSSFEEHVGAVEDLLIRGFLDKSLTTRDLALFKAKYLRVPELREKVAFAQRLRSAARSASEKPEVHLEPKVWPHWTKTMLTVAFATLGLICFVAAWVIAHNEHKADVSRLAAPTGEQARSTRASLEEVPGSPVISAILLPGLAKGAEDKPFRLSLSPGTTEVRLEFDMPGTHEQLLARVKVMLVQSNGRKLVWTEDRSPSVPTPLGRTVLVALKPDTLPSGDYIVYIEDSSQGPASEPLQSYAFGVVRP